MRPSTLFASGLVCLVAAAPAPRPQDINFDLAYALPDPTYSVNSDATAQTVTYTPSAIYASALPQITSTNSVDTLAMTSDATNVVKRAPATAAPSCTALPAGHGPIPSPDTPSAFLGDSDLADAANNAQTPSGYTLSFQNFNASNNAYGYMGYTTLTSYDVAGCASKCNAINGCVAFNIYFERDPSVDPGSGTQCSNPASTTNIKCVWWGGPVTAGNANNYGQYRNQFQVVIAGSNGYISNAIASVRGYNTAVPLGNAAINAPYDQFGFDSFMGSAIFTGGPFNAELCAQACTDKSNYAIAHPPTDGSPVQTCQFFNTYILYINSTSNPTNNQGQYCAMYSESWSSKYATNVGQYRGYDHFMIEYSFMYSNSTNAGTANANAAVRQASKDISWATYQPFCSSYLGYTIPVSTVVTTTTTTRITTAIVSVTAPASSTIYHKRDDATNVTASIPDSILALMKVPEATETAQNQKRALSTPAVLTKYPTAVLSSACQLQATKPATSTSTFTSTITGTPSTTTVTSTVATAAVPTVCSSGNNFKMQVVAPGTQYDGALIQNREGDGWFIGIGTDFWYKQFSPIIFTLDESSGMVQDVKSPGVYLQPFYLDARLALGYSSRGAGSVTCSVDSTTALLTCTHGTLNIFYIINNQGLTQLSLADANYTTTAQATKQSTMTPVQVQIKAVC